MCGVGMNMISKLIEPVEKKPSADVKCKKGMRLSSIRLSYPVNDPGKVSFLTDGPAVSLESIASLSQATVDTCFVVHADNYSHMSK